MITWFTHEISSRVFQKCYNILLIHFQFHRKLTFAPDSNHRWIKKWSSLHEKLSLHSVVDQKRTPSRKRPNQAESQTWSLEEMNVITIPMKGRHQSDLVIFQSMKQATITLRLSMTSQNISLKIYGFYFFLKADIFLSWCEAVHLKWRIWIFGKFHNWLWHMIYIICTV